MVFLIETSRIKILQPITIEKKKKKNTTPQTQKTNCENVMRFFFLSIDLSKTFSLTPFFLFIFIYLFLKFFRI